MTRRTLSSSRARKVITVQGQLQNKLTKKIEHFVSKKLNIFLSTNSFGLVAIYTQLDISRIGLVQGRASGYSCVQSITVPTIFEKVENFEKVEKCKEKQVKLNLSVFLYVNSSVIASHTIRRLHIMCQRTRRELYESFARSPWLTVYRASQVVSKKLNIFFSMNSFGLVAIYPKLDIPTIDLVQGRASGYF